MWQSTEPPTDRRVLVSAKGKVWIARRRPSWDWRSKTFGDPEWSFDAKTVSQTKDWTIDGWQPLPEAIGAPKRWEPTCYLDTLELSIRATNALRAANLLGKEQIMSLTRADLLRLKNVGAGTADEILKWREQPNPNLAERLAAAH
jgi:DNA-directed RNA polymerase alpha subunit